MSDNFVILLNNNMFSETDILQTSDNTLVKVVSIPKPQYFKWYWRVLNLLTFKKLFNARCTYIVKIINSNETN